MASKVLYTVVAVVGIAAASGAAWWYQNKPSTGGAGPSSAGGSPGAAAPQTGASAAAPARPAAVEVARVEVMRLIDDTQAVGSLRSRQGVVLRPEVSGRITQLNFRDGERVSKGQLLVQFDDQLPAAQLKQSLAEQSIAAANHKRNQDLLAQKFVSQRSVEESAANLEVAQAKVALAQATLERLKVKAPFDRVHSSDDSAKFVSGIRKATDDAGLDYDTYGNWGDQWTQDFFETAYMSMPAEGGQHVVAILQPIGVKARPFVELCDGADLPRIGREANEFAVAVQQSQCRDFRDELDRVVAITHPDGSGRCRPASE